MKNDLFIVFLLIVGFIFFQNQDSLLTNKGHPELDSSEPLVFEKSSDRVKAFLGVAQQIKLCEIYNKTYRKARFYKVEIESSSDENTLYASIKTLAYRLEKLVEKRLNFQHLLEVHHTYISYSRIQNQKTLNDVVIKHEKKKTEKDFVLSRLENIENQNKLYKRAQWIVILGVVLALVLLSYFYYHRLQKHRLENLKKKQESKRLLAIITAEEKERQRISNELHDGMASSITGIKMNLEDLSRNDASGQLKPLVDQLQKLHDETRRMSHNLMPLDLDHENWTDRLREYCIENSSQQFKIMFSNNIKSSVTLDPTISILLYRSVQELIHNVQKHSQADSCTVQISKLHQEIILSVEDDGIGFKNDKGKGQGLLSMRQRLTEIGAQLVIESKPGEGCLITISLKTPI